MAEPVKKASRVCALCHRAEDDPTINLNYCPVAPHGKHLLGRPK